MYLEEKENCGDYGDYGDLGEITSKYVFWCISGHGPFKNYLNKMKIADDKLCRYCKLNDETPLFLLYNG